MPAHQPATGKKASPFYQSGFLFLLFYRTKLIQNMKVTRTLVAGWRIAITFFMISLSLLLPEGWL